MTKTTTPDFSPSLRNLLSNLGFSTRQLMKVVRWFLFWACLISVLPLLFFFASTTLAVTAQPQP